MQRCPRASSLYFVLAGMFAASTVGLFASNALAQTTYLYVGNYYGDTLSGFSSDPTTGALTPVPGSPLPTGANPWIAVDQQCRFVFAANSGSNNISAYTISASTGTPTPVLGSPFPSGLVPTWSVVDHTGKFLFVPNSG